MTDDTKPAVPAEALYALACGSFESSPGFADVYMGCGMRAEDHGKSPPPAPASSDIASLLIAYADFCETHARDTAPSGDTLRMVFMDLADKLRVDARNTPAPASEPHPMVAAMVPREPTPDMVGAGTVAHRDSPVFEAQRIISIWRAMYDAAPYPMRGNSIPCASPDPCTDAHPVAWYQLRFICDRDGTPIGQDDPRVVWGSERPDDETWLPLYGQPRNDDNRYYGFPPQDESVFGGPNASEPPAAPADDLIGTLRNYARGANDNAQRGGDEDACAWMTVRDGMNAAADALAALRAERDRLRDNLASKTAERDVALGTLAEQEERAERAERELEISREARRIVERDVYMADVDALRDVLPPFGAYNGKAWHEAVRDVATERDRLRAALLMIQQMTDGAPAMFARAVNAEARAALAGEGQ